MTDPWPLRSSLELGALSTAASCAWGPGEPGEGGTSDGVLLVAALSTGALPGGAVEEVGVEAVLQARLPSRPCAARCRIRTRLPAPFRTSRPRRPATLLFSRAWPVRHPGLTATM
jgi:hypothetical protein